MNTLEHSFHRAATVLILMSASHAAGISAPELTCGGSVSGSTQDGGDAVSPTWTSKYSVAGPLKVYRLCLPVESIVEFSMCGTAFDSKLWMFDDITSWDDLTQRVDCDDCGSLCTAGWGPPPDWTVDYSANVHGGSCCSGDSFNPNAPPGLQDVPSAYQPSLVTPALPSACYNVFIGGYHSHSKGDYFLNVSCSATAAAPPATPPAPPHPAGSCAAEVDLVLVVQTSLSVAAEAQVIQAVANATVEQFALGADAVRVALVSYRDMASSPLLLSSDAAAVIEAINALPAPGGADTDIVSALEEAHDQFDWQPRGGAVRVVVLLSDGQQAVTSGGGSSTVSCGACVISAAQALKVRSCLPCLPRSWRLASAPWRLTSAPPPPPPPRIRTTTSRSSSPASAP